MSNDGKKVKVHYRGTLDDGTEFDSSYTRGEPIEFVCGGGQVIDGFDNAVKDMAAGDTVNVHLEPEEAYGPIDPAAIQEIPVTHIPNGDQLPVGKTIYMQGPEGFMPVQVVSIVDGIATLDMNHPMAGKALNFELTLVEVAE